MPLTTGTRFGAYQIVSALGEGGMGSVYRALDTRLNREVAIKVLHPMLAADLQRLARFRREAMLLASLNHPHVGAIYGLEEVDGTIALVLELIDGPTLADRLARGAVPLDEALSIARQIAEALEAAHEQGIIHRDLKPANIKVRDDGTVKVLDFGLAKALDTSGPAGLSATESPTITAPALTTGVGVMLGTAAYMSPEQAKMRTADKRSDVWAFGCVLYEMLTGARAFGGDEVPLVLAAVMTAAPDLGALPAATPPALRRMLRRCLEKDPRRRLQSIGDARVQLEELTAGVPEETAAQPAPRGALRPLGLGVAAAVALATSLATGILVWLAARSTVSRPTVSRLNIALPASAALSDGVSRHVAITPDGSRVVFVGANGTTLFVRPLDQLEATAIARGSAIRAPFVSPDGGWVGFFDGGLTLKKVPITGGPAVVVTRLDTFERGATWAPDGTIVFATQSTVNGLQRVSADGGAPVMLTRPNRERGEAGHAWPEMLPDGRAVLYSILPTTGGLDAVSLAVLDVRGSRSTILLGGGSHAQYVSSGHLVYGAGGTLRAIGFDTARLAVAGASTTMAAQIAISPFGGVDAAVARDGTLVYVTGGSAAARGLVWVDRQGRETPLAAPARAYYFPRLSRDGTRIAVNAVVDQNSDIWTWDLTRSMLTRATTDPDQDAFPLWMPDGRRVVFGSNRVRAFNLFSQAADGTGAAERLTQSSNPQYPSDVSRDGRRVLFTEMFPATGYDVMALALDGSRGVLPLVQTPFDERNGVVSPDSRWLAYEANDTGPFEIYIRPYPDVSGGRWQVSTSGGTQPLWAPDGKELFYFAPDGALMQVAVGAGLRWTAGPPVRVLDGRYVVSTGGNLPRNYDVAPDGQRFLMLKTVATDAAAPPTGIIVVQHFDEELRRVATMK